MARDIERFATSTSVEIPAGVGIEDLMREMERAEGVISIGDRPSLIDVLLRPAARERDAEFERMKAHKIATVGAYFAGLEGIAHAIVRARVQWVDQQTNALVHATFAEITQRMHRQAEETIFSFFETLGAYRKRYSTIDYLSEGDQRAAIERLLDRALAAEVDWVKDHRAIKDALRDAALTYVRRLPPNAR